VRLGAAASALPSDSEIHRFLAGGLNSGMCLVCAAQRPTDSYPLARRVISSQLAWDAREVFPALLLSGVEPSGSLSVFAVEGRTTHEFYRELASRFWRIQTQVDAATVQAAATWLRVGRSGLKRLPVPSKTGRQVVSVGA
jgi:hypothetical protein